MSKSFRKISRKFHLWLSLIFCIPLIIISISGSVLVYAEQINEVLLKDKVFRTQESIAKFPVRMKFSTLQSEINSKFKEYAIMGWSIAQDASKTDKIRLSSQKLQKQALIYLDAFNGEIKGASIPRAHGFIGAINKLHAELFLGRGGRIFTGIVGLSALLIGISGFFYLQKILAKLILAKARSGHIFYARHSPPNRSREHSRNVCYSYKRSMVGAKGGNLQAARKSMRRGRAEF